jgi:hypothetical protein
MPGNIGRPKGSPKTGGRKKGTPNKATTAVKEAFRQAFEDLGGTQALVTWAMENPTQFYQLYSKLIPTDVNVGGQEGAPAVRVEIVKSVSK